MQNPTTGSLGPLARLTDEEISQLLRGFDESAIQSASALRSSSSRDDIQTCLVGILIFYLPSGTPPPETLPTGDTLLRDNLGLDSMSFAEAMFKIEELFDILVDNTEIAELLTVNDACQLLIEKLEAPSLTKPDE